MNYYIEKYNPIFEKDWEIFIANAKNATFLHSRNFIKHNPLNKEDDFSLLFYKNKDLIAVFPANVYLKDGKKIVHSYLRATYGGIIYSNKISILDLLSIIKLLIEEAKNNNIDEIIIRPSFAIYHTNLSSDLEYALWILGFKTKYKEIELAINLEFNLDDNYSDSNLRNIKKAKKNNIVINKNGNIEKYWQILTENLQQKHNAKPVHNYNEICTLIELVGTDKIKLFTAEFEGEIIGGILLFIANFKVVHAQYIASNEKFQEYRPLNILIDYIAHWAKEKGYKYFNLGMACEPGGKIINEGLYKFKEGFGARGIIRETLHLQLS